MQGDRLKVLLVEDNYMNKVLVREILALNGYEIIEAMSGTEALKMLMMVKPDIILMDIHLPEMDGFTATRIIKADERNRNIPVLALTASAMKGEEEKILSQGFDGYIAKPIEVKKLLAVISASLSGKKEDSKTEGSGEPPVN